MHAVLKKILYEILFALVVFTFIPFLMLLGFYNVTIEIFKRAPKDLEELVRLYVYGE
tara:strand:+ start:3811 stop:3981 length:171 start_codon:yes stop_codon:yes gene_type:complete